MPSFSKVLFSIHKWKLIKGTVTEKISLLKHEAFTCPTDFPLLCTFCHLYSGNCCLTQVISLLSWGLFVTSKHWDYSWAPAGLGCWNSKPGTLVYLVWTQMLQDLVGFLVWDVDDVSVVMFWRLKEEILGLLHHYITSVLEAMRGENMILDFLQLVRHVSF